MGGERAIKVKIRTQKNKYSALIMQGSNGLYRTTHIRKVFAESIVLDYIDLIEIRCGDFKETNSPIIGYSSLVS